MSGLDRRAFLRRVAVASAGGAGATLLPAARPAAASHPVGAANDVAWKRAPCPFCSVGCGLLIGLRDGRAIAVKGDPDSPVNRGLACVKGYHATQALAGRDRIMRARIRRGGRLVEASMADALDVVAGTLRETLSKHGHERLAVYGSAHWTVADRYVAAKLFRGALGTRNVASDLALEAASADAGLLGSLGMAGAAGSYEDIEHADVFVLWNHNIAETEPVLFSRMLARRRTNPGVRIIDVTTRTTRTSYAADRSLLYAPHTEIALAHALCHEIVHRRWADRGFVDRYVAFRKGTADLDYGLGAALTADSAVAADWDEYVRFLADYAPERAERLTGMPAEDVRWLASVYGDRARRVLTLWGAGVNQQVRGTWANNALTNVHLLVGKVATPGNAAFCTTGAADSCTALECGGPLQPADGPGAESDDTQKRFASLVWDVPAATIDARRAPGVLPLFRALERGDVRFLWTQGTDPLTSLPNASRFRSAIAARDCFVVASDAYPTPTTDAADVVLPAALWIECGGVAGNVERRVQYFDRLIAPPGEAQGMAWQMIEVAHRLGLQEQFPWAAGAHVAASWQEYARFHAAASRRLPPLSELRTGTGALWPYVDGRETKWRYNTAYDAAADKARGAFDFYGHTDHRAWIWLRPHQPPAEAPDAAFPFWLATGRVLEHDGAATRRVATLHRAMPRAFVELNAMDAADLGVRTGDRVRLSSRRGTLELEARIDHRSQPARGSVFVPSFDETVPVNVLTLDAACPLSGQPDYTCAVRVERLGRGGAA